MQRKNNSSIFVSVKKFILWTAAVLFALALAVAAFFYFTLFAPAFEKKAEIKIRIRSGWSMEKLADELKAAGGLKNKENFIFWTQKLGYKKVQPCNIIIPANCGIYKLSNILKQNRYQTINITIRGSMDQYKLASVLSSKLEIDSLEFLKLLNDSNISGTGFNHQNWQALMVANTYNFAIADNSGKFFVRMKKEYDKFWNAERLEKAKKQNLSQVDVAIIASIVTKESNKTDEYENIAGVYINRLRKKMLLQADPTVVFIRNHGGRVTGEDLKIESPYNTYLHEGLPPGPICIPNISAIEAVLNYSGHQYLYFVAMPDFSGYHHFSATLQEHNLWARKFHAALNARNIH